MLQILTFTLGPVSTNAYLLGNPDSGEAICIDPAWDGHIILNEAQTRGWRVTNIWLTHGHFDHLAGGAAVADGSNPPPPVAIHPDDYWWWRNEGGALFFGYHIDPGPEPTIDLLPEMKMYLGSHEIEVRHAPGHTKGHVMFCLPQDKVCFCGDVIFQGSIGRTDLPGGDFHTLIESIRTQVLTLPDDTRLLPGHGPATTVGFERRHNPFLQ